jgi:hypothetical protein
MLASTYLGPMISEADKKALVGLATAYPAAAVWNVTIGMSRDLQFTTDEVSV